MGQAKPTVAALQGPLPPTVDAYYPRPGEEVPLDAELTWTFDQPVDLDSVSTALHIVPTLEGLLAWADDRTAVFTPDSLTPGGRYAVSLSTEVESTSGLRLTEGLDYTFSVLAPLQVTRTAPSPGAMDVRGDTAVVLEFNYPMASANCVGEVGEGHEGCPQLSLSFTPAVMGSAYWANTSRYVFESLTGFAAGQIYEASLAQDAASVAGASLPTAYVWSFETAAPRVEQRTPEPGAKQVMIDSVVRVTFNTPMDRDATAGDLLLTTEAGEAVPGTIRWLDNGAVLVFQPRAPLALDTTYEVRIGSRARAEGSAPLPAQEPWSFSTVGPPELLSHMPTDAAARTGIYAPVQLTFAGAIDEAALRAGVLVTSTRRIHDVFGTYDEADGIYSIAWEREPRTDYCVSVAADVSDVYGNILGEPSRFCFETGDLPPLVEPAPGFGAATLDAGRPSAMGFLVRNAAAVDFRLLEADVPAFMQQGLDDGAVLRAWTETIDIVPNLVVPARVSLQRASAALPTGLYHLTWEVPGEAGYDRRLPLAVVDRHVMIKLSDEDALVWVTDLATGEPISRTEVQVLDQEGLLVAGGTTDVDGLARLPLSDSGDGSLWKMLAAVTGQSGEAGFGIALTTWEGGAAPWQYGIVTDMGPGVDHRAFLVTDRPIYRPGQTVEIAGLLREVVGGQYQLPSGPVTATLALVGRDGQAVDRAEIAVGENGRFQHAVSLPRALASGDYMISVFLPADDERDAPPLATLMVTVTPYRKPSYRVTVEPGAEGVIDGDDIEIAVEAAYYAGGVVADADVAWQVYAEPYRFSPARGDRPSPEAWIWQKSMPSTGRRLVAEGRGVTDDRGTMKIRLPADLAPLGEMQDVVSQRWVIDVTVTDASGFPVAGRGDVNVHSTDLYIGLMPGSWVARPKERLTMDLEVLTWDGTPRPEQRVDLVLVRRTWYEPTPSETWAYTDTVVSEQTVETGAEGRASATFTAPRSGLYVVKAVTGNASGSTSGNEISYWVGGDDGGGWPTRDSQLMLKADADTYQVGDVAKVLVPVMAEDPYQLLVTVEQDGVISATRHVLDHLNPIVEIPILDAYTPNVYVSVVAVRAATESEPAMGALGYIELPVDPVTRLLDVDLSTREASYRPGEPVALTIRVEDHQGAPAEADVTVAVVDRAVLDLAAWPRPSLVEALYGNRPLRVLTGDGLLVAADIGQEALSALAAASPSGPGASAPPGMGGDAGVDDPRGAETPRQNFADTAYWSTVLRTDGLGSATTVFTLPDSLTTWDVHAWAVTDESQVGEGQVTFDVEKPLFVSPVTPRFFVVGDRTEVAALVHNHVTEDLVATVGLSVSSGLALETPALKQLTVGAGDARRVSWPVSVHPSQDGIARLTLSVRSGEYADASRPTYGAAGLAGLPILAPEMSEAIGFSGDVAPGAASVELVDVPAEARSGTGLQIKLIPGYASLLSDELASMDICRDLVDTCVNELLPALSSYRVLVGQGAASTSTRTPGPGLTGDASAALGEALTWVFEHQNPDGGWGWWRTWSNLHLTSYVIHVLQQAQAAGFAVRADRMDAALSYVSEMIERGMAAGLRYPHFALGLRVLSQSGWAWPQGAGSGLYSDRRALGLEGRAHLAVAYGLMDPLDTRIVTLLDEIRSEASVRGSAVHWEEIDAEHWTTPVQLTAVIVDALTILEPGATELAPAVRWLVGARDADGWGTGYESAWALTAVANYVELQGAPEGVPGSMTVSVNGQPISLTEQAGAGEWSTVEAFLLLGDVGDDGGPLRRGKNLIEIAYGPGNAQALTYTGLLDLVLPVEGQTTALSRGLTVSRRYCRSAPRADEQEATMTDGARGPCGPVTRVATGELVDVHLLLTVPETRYFVDVVDTYPAGFEPVAEPPATWSLPRADDGPPADSDGTGEERRVPSPKPFLPVDIGETTIRLLAETVSPGMYEITYTMRAAIPGTYHALPAAAAERFFPEVRGRTPLHQIEIVD